MVYRVFFHPLVGIPGPFWAKITDLWHARQMTSGVRHKLLYRLHKKHGEHPRVLLCSACWDGTHSWRHHCPGPLVRLGPNTVSVDTVEGLTKIFSATAPIDKSPFYQSFTPGFKSSFSSTGSVFKEKKSILARAFSQKKLDAMESSFMHHTKTLCQVLKTDGRAELDEILSALTIDILSDVCFGDTFDLLHHPEEKKKITKGLEHASEYVALVRRPNNYATFRSTKMTRPVLIRLPSRKGPFGDGPFFKPLFELSPTSSQRADIRHR